jgi:hypothetical protein
LRVEHAQHLGSKFIARAAGGVAFERDAERDRPEPSR